MTAVGEALAPSYALFRRLGMEDAPTEHLGVAPPGAAPKAAHLCGDLRKPSDDGSVSYETVVFLRFQDGPCWWWIGGCNGCGTVFYYGPNWDDPTNDDEG